MPCYARACRRVRPCPSQRICEATWHACEPPDYWEFPDWHCDVCDADWTLHLGGQPNARPDISHMWHRDPWEG